MTRGESTAQLFLGTRLQCAQCHNHPFDRWTQDDYYSWADVFGRVDYKIIRNDRTDKNDSHEFIGEQMVITKTSGDVLDPRTGLPVKPRLLGTATTISDDGDRLDALANWIVSDKNPMFARTMANRIWAQFMGRGIVDPVDDFRATNPPTHPALLDALAKELVEHHYDARYLIRLIMASQVYALSAAPGPTNQDDEINYSHAVPRRLTAEQLLDAAHQVAGVPTTFAGYPGGTRAEQIIGVQAVRPRDQRPTAADQFLVAFGKPPRLISCDCERSNETTLNQTFQLVSGPEISNLLSAPGNRIAALMRSGESDARVIDELYWAALSRSPTPREATLMTEHVRTAGDRRQAIEDVAWALLNAKEFVLRW